MATRAWLPSDATSAALVGWFDAQDASTLTVESGGGVSAWRSKVGGWSVTQTTAANRPPLSTYNNLPSVLPTTDQQFLSGAAPVTLPTGGDAGSMTGVGTVIAYRNTYSTMFYWGSANQNKARSIAATGNAVSSGYYGNDVQGNVTWPGFTRLFISSISATGYAEQWVDGGTVQGAQKNVLSTPTTSTFWVGRSINGDPWKNPIQEICLWKGTLSADERAKLEGYYAWRWNLVSQLPSSHAYKAAAPSIDDGSGGATGPTGSAATTLAAVTVASAAVLAIASAAAVALAPISGIATGTAPIAAQASSTLGGFSAAGPGGLVVSGSAAAALGQITSASAGSMPLTGQAATQIGSVTAVASATLPVTGAASPTLGQIATISAARADITGSASASLGPVISAGTGSSGQLTSGQAAAVLAPVTAVAAGTLPLSATASAPIAPITTEGAGQLTARGQAAATLGAITAVAVGSAPRAAIAAAQLAPVSSAAVASLPIAGAATAMLGPIVIVATAAGDPDRPGGPAVILPQHRFVVPARQRAFAVPARPRAFLIRKGICMSSINKYPAEERQYQADWTPDLAEQTIVGDPVASSSDPTLIVDEISMDGAVMKYWIRGGTSGRSAKIRFVAGTSGGEDLVFEQTVICY